MDLEEAIGGARALGLYELLRQRLLRTVPVAGAAAGADWAIVAPAAWELLGVRYGFVTSAVVANRASRLRFVDPAANINILNAVPAAVQAASLTVAYTWWAGTGTLASLGLVQNGSLPNPPLLAPPGTVIGTTTDLLDVGDQYTNVSVFVREWSSAAVLAACEWLRAHVR